MNEYRDPLASTVRPLSAPVTFPAFTAPVVTGQPPVFLAVPTVCSPTPFVHERRTVRTSERTAEIWVKFPPNAYVSVNFVEYPPEGDFRIFRTRLTTNEPRRYYLSARRWARDEKQWISLVSGASLSNDGTVNAGYVDLGPGQRAVIEFSDGHPVDSLVDVPSLQAQVHQLKDQLQRHDQTVTARLTEESASILSALAEQTETLNSAIDEKLNAIQSTLAQAVSPQKESTTVTKSFLFHATEMQLAAKAAVSDERIASVNWTKHPETLNIAAASGLKALPDRPFKAQITFMIRQSFEEPFASLEPITVEFRDGQSGIEGEIPFTQVLAGPLEAALVSSGVRPADLQLSATMAFSLQIGELGTVPVVGALGNEIELTIVP